MFVCLFVLILKCLFIRFRGAVQEPTSAGQSMVGPEAAVFLVCVIVFFFFLVVRAAPIGRSVCVVVLGDYGRSPRMQYHTLSLARSVDVSVVAYSGSAPLASIINNPRVTFNMIRQPPALPKSMPRLVFLLYAPVKVAFQTLQVSQRAPSAVPTLHRAALHVCCRV